MIAHEACRIAFDLVYLENDLSALEEARVWHWSLALGFGASVLSLAELIHLSRVTLPTGIKRRYLRLSLCGTCGPVAFYRPENNQEAK
jgi:hypothetical protein